MRLMTFLLVSALAFGAPPPERKVFQVIKEIGKHRSLDVWLLIPPPVNPATIRKALDQAEATRWGPELETICIWTYSSRKAYREQSPCGYLIRGRDRRPPREVEIWEAGIK